MKLKVASRLLVIMVIGWFVVGVGGCFIFPSGAPHGGMGNYSWGFYNAGDLPTVYEVTFQYHGPDGSDQFVAGILASGSTEYMSSGLVPIPSEVHVTWKVAHTAAVQEQVVKIPDEVAGRRDFEGTVWLRHQKSGWNSIAYTKEEEMDRAVRRAKELGDHRGNPTAPE